MSLHPEIAAVPLTRRAANEFIRKHHRHHGAIVGDIFRIGAAVGGMLAGVVTVGRPSARFLDDGWTAEATRLCSDGTPNVCSFLYARAARVAFDLGYTHIVTYILACESGVSLRAAGWIMECDSPGGAWDCVSRPRHDKHPLGPKVRYGRTASTPRPLFTEAHVRQPEPTLFGGEQ